MGAAFDWRNHSMQRVQRLPSRVERSLVFVPSLASRSVNQAKAHVRTHVFRIWARVRSGCVFVCFQDLRTRRPRTDTETERILRLADEDLLRTHELQSLSSVFWSGGEIA